MESYETYFELDGKQHSLKIHMHYPTASGYLFAFYINNFFNGTLNKVGDQWQPVHIIPITDKNRHNTVFELQGADYQILGEMIEEHLPQYI